MRASRTHARAHTHAPRTCLPRRCLSRVCRIAQPFQSDDRQRVAEWLGPRLGPPMGVVVEPLRGRDTDASSANPQGARRGGSVGPHPRVGVRLAVGTHRYKEPWRHGGGHVGFPPPPQQLPWIRSVLFTLAAMLTLAAAAAGTRSWVTLQIRGRLKCGLLSKGQTERTRRTLETRVSYVFLRSVGSSVERETNEQRAAKTQRSKAKGRKDVETTRVTLCCVFLRSVRSSRGAKRTSRGGQDMKQLHILFVEQRRGTHGHSTIVAHT